MTPKTRRRFFFSGGDSDKSKNKSDNNNTEKERPKFRIRLDRSPSPGSRTKMRPPKVKISPDNSSPEISVRRSRSEYIDRPRSENYSNSLAIPKPNYVRQNSATSFGSYANTSSSDSVIEPEATGQYLLPSPVSGENSPVSSKRVSPSQRRPLGVRSHAYPGWERERWRQWELLAAEGGDEGYEKETLVWPQARPMPRRDNWLYLYIFIKRVNIYVQISALQYIWNLFPVQYAFGLMQYEI